MRGHLIQNIRNVKNKKVAFQENTRKDQTITNFQTSGNEHLKTVYISSVALLTVSHVSISKKLSKTKQWKKFSERKEGLHPP